MSLELAQVLVLLGIAIAMFVAGRPRLDAVALIMIVLLPATGVLDMNEALAGFSDPNIVLVAALFVIGEGLVRTGVAQGVGDWLVRHGGSSETRLLVLMMLAVGLMGSFMSSTAVVAIFIPIVMRIAQQTGIAASQLLMPVSVAGLISGMMTLVATTPNLVVNGELMRHGEAGFSFFVFTPIGVPVLVLAIAYMAVARRWLPSQRPSAGSGRPSLNDWVDQYQLHDRAFRLAVEAQSPLVGRSLAGLGLGDSSAARVIALERQHTLRREVLRVSDDTEIRAGDILLLDVESKDFDLHRLCERHALHVLPISGAYFTDQSRDVGMAEAIIPVDSTLVGTTGCESRLLAQHGLTVVGLRRGRVTHAHGLENARLQVGDTLLLVGPWQAIRVLQSDGHDLVGLSLPLEGKSLVPAPRRAPHAVFCLVLVIGLMMSGLLPNVQAALLGCLLMGLFRCIDLDTAYRAIHWRSLILIVGMLPFSLALQRTGGIDLAADGLLALVGDFGVRTVLASLFVLCTLIGLVIPNTATAVLMAPVALALATHLGASPYPFAMMVALAASSGFLTPISSPVNTLVSTAGNYSFGDFVKVGLPLATMVLLLSVLLVPWLLPP
ncbi:SLC13 family permease [Variovorax saccharolyticus]|uniref:SLC13 family permease n=1 Tax=Variovorax saccharolyticus TaxID=3053516 RepID=UPI0025757C6D|nr:MULTISPECIES: SLC13 family permease [unclassified Variovorax]MDM0020096.1 SLC13 family permease [Variovorax sp. J22R187]MDM0023727.1 SLC13 family permease [Variovorax sp. J31P216]